MLENLPGVEEVAKQGDVQGLRPSSRHKPVGSARLWFLVSTKHSLQSSLGRNLEL